MRNKVYWTLGVLMILLIAVTTVVVVRNNNEAQRVRDELEKLEAQKKAENTPEVVEISDEVSISDPPEPVEPPPVEEKPQVTEVSNGTGKFPDVMTMTDEEFREWHRGDCSSEEYEGQKELELTFFPKLIEQIERAVASYEASIKKDEEFFQKYPNSREYFRKTFGDDRQRLADDRRQLNRMKRTMEVIHGIK